MEIKDIQELIELVNQSTLTEVEIEQNDFKLKIKRKYPDNNVIYTQAPATAAVAPPAAVPVSSPAPVSQAAASAAPAAPPAPSDNGSNLIEFHSPMIGTFYRASAPDQPPFIKVGDSIQKGDVLCVVEAMKLFNEIEAETDGKIVKIMVENAQPVEYDQVLFLIEPAS